jgi:polar amino acid transport system substrate-binding protein/cystine transport system substrate-binding protein/membrane-bound lytic murein transglycosylase F
MAQGLTSMPTSLPAHWRKGLSYLFIFAPLAAVYALPPDTSLGEVKRAGVLRACVPLLYPPLVTDDPAAPGIDVELLRGLAKNLGLRLDLSRNDAMGRDFNPRSWHVTRAQCEVLAGGIVASPVTRSFLETSPSYAETGWAVIVPKPLTTPPSATPPLAAPPPAAAALADLEGRRAMVLAGFSGLDRIGLARYLREHMIAFGIAPSAAELVQGLRDGRFDFGVTERLFADQLASREGWSVAWAPPELPRYPVVLGLWKGDLTLKRAIVGGLEKLERDGEMAAIIARYLGKAGAGREKLALARGAP